jgi:hypothetical protein
MWGASESLREHGPAGCVQAHSEPAIPVAIRPFGTVSVNDTVPLVAAPPELDTVMV